MSITFIELKQNRQICLLFLDKDIRKLKEGIEA